MTTTKVRTNTEKGRKGRVRTDLSYLNSPHTPLRGSETSAMYGFEN